MRENYKEFSLSLKNGYKNHLLTTAAVFYSEMFRIPSLFTLTQVEILYELDHTLAKKNLIIIVQLPTRKKKEGRKYFVFFCDKTKPLMYY